MNHEKSVRKMLSSRTAAGTLKSRESNTVEFKESLLSKPKWKLLLAFIIFIVAIPLGINSLFKLTSPLDIFVAEWTAGDMLGFYGALLASVATIIGVYLSIEYAQKNYREDEQNRVRPYLALTYIRTKSNCNLFGGSNDSSSSNQRSEELYKEFRLDKVYIIISKDGIAFKDGLTSQQQELLEKAGFSWKGTENGYILVATDYVSLPFEVDNVGNGAAIELKLGLYRNDSDKHRGVRLYTLKPSDKIYFHVFSELEDDSLYGDYTLEFKYRDIQGTNYSQVYPFSIQKENGKVKQTIDLTGKQEIVKEDTL